VIERDQLAHQQQIRLRKERVGAKALREPLRPGRAGPAQVADVASTEGRHAVYALRPLRLERVAQRSKRLLFLAQREARSVRADADVAVAPERSLEKEGVAPLLLIEETEDAERRQQITGKFDGGRCASKACSGSEVACGGD